MSAIVDLTDEEAYLYAILTDDSGIDLSEFEFSDPESPDGCYRLFDYQWELDGETEMYQATQGGRATGKSMGIQKRSAAFPWCYPGSDMLLTAPELNHLRPVTNAVESRLTSTWLLRQMLPISGKSDGFTRQPHWECHFVNGSKIVSRLPNRDGRGVKGQHALRIELDEAQDYPLAGWVEIVEALNRFQPKARWRVHGVPRGVRDRFYEITQGASGTGDWRVHRPMGMMRPSWSKSERDDKTKIYGGSRQSNDYKRNIYGEHGDATNALFVLARLVACTDMSENSEYNTDVYTNICLDFDILDGASPLTGLDFPAAHRTGWPLAKSGYASYHAGMDVGVTSHPSEILLFGQRAGTDREALDLLLRVQMLRIPPIDQEAVVERLFEWYGKKLLSFGIDQTGVGFDLSSRLKAKYPGRMKGYNFSAKYVIGLEDRELEIGETNEDLQIERNIVTYASDLLREMVDAKSLLLPNDGELLQEWQGQNYAIVKSTQDPYGKRAYSQGKFHTLDAGKMMAAAKRLAPLDEMLARDDRSDVLDIFMGA